MSTISSAGRPLRALLLLALVLPGASAVSGCDSQQVGTCSSNDEFAIQDITPADATLGAAAQPSQCVTVDYVGRLADGSGTFDEGTLSFFLVTNGGVIPGFALGVIAPVNEQTQQVGQTRRVTVPPDFGYGGYEREARKGTVGGVEGGEPYVGIPSCSTLEFDITLTRINQDGRLCRGG